MLDERDIQIIKELLSEQEARLTGKLEDARKSAVEDSTRYMDILYETKIAPQLRILAEGQETLLETMAPKSRLDAVEEELAFQKTLIASLSKDVEALKQAI